jgi:HEAT repeats
VKPALWILAAALPLAAQPKLLVNAQLDTRPAAGSLDRVFRELAASQPQPAWIAYSVPAVRGYGLGCEYVRDDFHTAGIVHLEPPADAVILFRIESNALTRIRTLSPVCEIDAGGLPVHWLTGVEPSQSVALLASYLPARDRLGDSMVSAISVHAGPAADEALDRCAASDQPLSLRRRAVSAMARRGPHGFEALQKILASDPDERVRERAVSAIAGYDEPGAAGVLIATARTNPDSRLRVQAVSALTRKPTPQTVDILAAIAESDPDRDVRCRAINALHSLPDDRGVPALIRLAKTSRDPEVRKQSMSSLAQSHDPRALALFEEILK